MAQVRRLVNEGADVKPADNVPASSGTLVENGPPNEQMKGVIAILDGMFGDLPVLKSNDAIAVASDLGGSQVGPYIGRASDRSPSWASQQAAGCQNGDLYLGVEGQIIKTHPLVYWLVTGTVFRTQMDDAGNIVAASTDIKSESGKHGMKLDQHLLALVLVDLGSRIVPAKADFRGTFSGAGTPAVKGVAQAGDPNWSKLSEAHKVSAAFPIPWGRVVTTATTQARVAKSSGRKYFAGVAAARPANIDQMQRLQAAMSDPSFQALLSQAKESYTERFETIKALCK